MQCEHSQNKAATEKEKAMDKQGWGSWAGIGAPTKSAKSTSGQRLRDKNKPGKSDRGGVRAVHPNVLVSDRRIKGFSQYKVSMEKVPHPFRTMEEYHRSLQNPLGGEWNASHIVSKNTAPEVLLRAGRVINPMAK